MFAYRCSSPRLGRGPNEIKLNHGSGKRKWQAHAAQYLRLPVTILTNRFAR